MGKSYLDSEELALGNKWLKTIFFPAVNNGNIDSNYLAFPTYSSVIGRLANACQEIYKFITSLKWDTGNDLEGYIELLNKSNARYKIDPNGYDEPSNTYKFSTSQICRIIANLCAKCEIFWDDTQHTPEELRYFIATPMGKALWDFRCFISQEPDTIKVKASSNTPSTTRTTTPSSGGSGSSSSGSNLNLSTAGGLVSQTKEILPVSDMFWIDGQFVNPGKTKPRLHVKPFNGGSTLAVSYGSGQGYDDCVLFFDDYNKANDFMAKAAANLPSNVSSLSIKRQKVDPNGYFKVNTQYGEAYIKASKLHEALEQLEALEENKEPEVDWFEKTRKACEALEAFMR